MIAKSQSQSYVGKQEPHPQTLQQIKHSLED